MTDQTPNTPPEIPTSTEIQDPTLPQAAESARRSLSMNSVTNFIDKHPKTAAAAAGLLVSGVGAGGLNPVSTNLPNTPDLLTQEQQQSSKANQPVDQIAFQEGMDAGRVSVDLPPKPDVIPAPEQAIPLDPNAPTIPAPVIEGVQLPTTQGIKDSGS